MELEEEIEEIEEHENELDISWIENFESIDVNYKLFYTEDITKIKFRYIYVNNNNNDNNNNNNIEKIKEEVVSLRTPNYISREELIGLIKKHNKFANKSYTILSIVKYNITIEPADIHYYLACSTPETTFNFLTSIKNIDAIPLEKTISMFQRLNDITIIFYEKTENDRKNQQQDQYQNQTKRIFIKRIHGNKHKKTYRKTY